jgi:outer membrane protein OmpA-like peptidoglycan-associated protein
MNVQLSRQRAQTVRQYLIKKGVSPKRLKAEGFGPDKPKKDDTSTEARASNRRVEFVVVSEEAVVK